MPDFEKVAKLSEVVSSGKMLVEYDDQLVVLVYLDEKVYAIADVCTHDGGPLSDGPVEDSCIACPRHGAKFDIRTGKAVTMPATEDTKVFEVKIDGDDVLVGG